MLFLSSMAEGPTLNLCCGFDSTGDVLLDQDMEILQGRQDTITERLKVNGDVYNLPFKYSSFDTVICDPPYSFYAKQAWIFEIFKLARKRVILSVPTVDIRPPEGWSRELYYIGSNHYMLRLWFVYTIKEHNG